MTAIRDTEYLYRCLKKMEHTAQGMLFEIPQVGSEAYEALRLDPGEAWKMGSLIDTLLWFQSRVKTAANRVYIDKRREEPSSPFGHADSDSASEPKGPS